jgi:di/tricarboxylate transporter
MQTSGLATLLAQPVIQAAGDSSRGTLALVYAITMVLAGLIGGKASGALVLPLAYAVSTRLNLSFMPFGMAILFASSISIATPIGHTTNLMVYSPGGYRFSDFLKVGGPLSLILWALCVWWIPLQWPF